MIYEHVLSFGTLTYHEPHWDTMEGRRPCPCPSSEDSHTWSLVTRGRELTCADPIKMLAILSVCRSIYEEAMPTFYNKNRFMFMTLSHLHVFLKNISLPRRQALREIMVRYGFFGYWSKEIKVASVTFKMLKDSMPLKAFCMNFPEAPIFDRKTRIQNPESGGCSRDKGPQNTARDRQD